MKDLATVARITTPAAMIVFMTYEISQSLGVGGLWYIFLLIGAAFSSIGVEIAGVLAGRVMEGGWRQKNYGRAAVAFAILILYTGVAIYILRNNSTLMAVPVVAAIVYVLASMSDGLAITETEQQIVATNEMERARLAETAAMQHQFNMDELNARLAHEAGLAKLNAQATVGVEAEKAKAKIAEAETRRVAAEAKLVAAESARKARPVSVETSELSGKALEIYSLLQEKPAATNTEIGESVGVSRQYVGQVRRELNGRLSNGRIG